jgi:hypothetical protein
VTRSFHKFTEAAHESGMSRIYAGIHWSFDVAAGWHLGRNVGQYVAENFFLPVAEPAFSGQGHHFGTIGLSRGVSFDPGDVAPTSVAPQTAFITPALWRHNLETDRVTVWKDDPGIDNLVRSLADAAARRTELTLHAAPPAAPEGILSSAGPLDPKGSLAGW